MKKPVLILKIERLFYSQNHKHSDPMSMEAQCSFKTYGFLKFFESMLAVDSSIFCTCACYVLARVHAQYADTPVPKVERPLVVQVLNSPTRGPSVIR